MTRDNRRICVAGAGAIGGYLAARLAGGNCGEALREGHLIASQVIAQYGALVALRKAETP